MIANQYVDLINKSLCRGRWNVVNLSLDTCMFDNDKEFVISRQLFGIFGLTKTHLLAEHWHGQVFIWAVTRRTIMLIELIDWIITSR